MRLVSFDLDGTEAFGAVIGSRVVNLSARLGVSLLDFIAGKSEASAVLAAGETDFDLDALTLLPAVPRFGKMICVGLNYEAHRQETTRTPTEMPMLFARFPSSLVGHQRPLVIPRISDMLDWEAEIAVVIGKSTGRYLPAEAALQHVFGYAVMNEGSVRDWQRHSSQVTAGKNFDRSGALGPWLVTADEVPDPQDLNLELRVNGTLMQQAHTSAMIWTVAKTIEYISNWTSLEPGDIIASGTPAGVGSRRTPPIFLKTGDIVEVEVERLGLLRNPVIKET